MSNYGALTTITTPPTNTPRSAISSALSRCALLAASVSIFTGLWFALLARRPLYDPDEGRYAEIPREMLAGGNWVIPHLNGLVYLEKPPLHYWLTALALRMFGQSEFAARLTTGLAGYCCLALICLVAYRLWGLRTAVVAGCLTSASTLFVLMAHQMTLDMLLSLWLFASLTCFLMAEFEHANDTHSGSARGWMLGSWASMALAVLTKGLIGVLIPAATLVAYALWQRDFSGLRRLYIKWGLPLFAVITMPWFAMAARANPAFLEFFFVREHFRRFLTDVEHRSQPWWFFGPVLVIGILPWVPQAVRATSRTLLASKSRSFDPARILCAWTVFVLVFFSLSHAKLIPYILPAVPSLALLAAMPAGHDDARRDLLGGALASLAAALGIVLYATGSLNSGQSRVLALWLAPVVNGTAALLVIGSGCCLLLRRKNRLDAALAVLCGGWFLASLSILIGANRAQQFFSSKDAADALNAHVAASSPVSSVQTPVFSVQTYEQAMTFYLKRTVVLVDYRDEFALGLDENPDRGIASLALFADRWRSLGDGYAIMPYYTRDHLVAMGLPLYEIAHFPSTVLVSRKPSRLP